ncbi:MAG: tetratricopeptide repeat protein [Desulfosalsimonadaceae bacterium]
MISRTEILKKLSRQQCLMLISLLLAVATVAAYLQVRGFDFISFDDDLYVFENQRVQQGLNADNLIWAFNPAKTDDQAYWHPLAWLSHMLDCQLFGLNPGAHHLVNLVFHTLNVLLLLLALFLMTGSPWRSGFVAALFALHPINVDSVVWIAERKNLLSTSFWMLTLLSYLYYTKRPNTLRYLLLVVSLTLGLLAKPMLVTLPCVLLLIDFWPLGRMDLGHQIPSKGLSPVWNFQSAGVARLIIEKIPLIVLSLITIGLSVFTLQAKDMMIDHNTTPMMLRIENAIVSYVGYLWKMIWPVNFGVVYPFPKTIPLWQPMAALLFLISASLLILMRVRKSPYLVTGWLWYLGTLLPVIGLVQGGFWPAIADRWAYVPLIGIFIIIAWGIPELVENFPLKKTGLPVLSAGILCVLWVLAWNQIRFWRDSRTLFEHTLSVTRDNFMIHNNLGVALSKQGRMDLAIDQYLKSLRIRPGYADAHYNLANIYKDQARLDQAVYEYLQTLRIKPDHEKAHNNLGSALLSMGRPDEAIKHYQQALQINPDYVDARYNLGIAYVDTGDIDQAIQQIQAALRLRPSDDNILNTLNIVLMMQNSSKPGGDK